MREKILAHQLPIEKSLRQLLDRRRAKSTLRKLTTSPAQAVDFSSNDFLSLSTSPILHAAFLRELRNSKVRLGSGGSRLLDGNSSYAEDLERDIAAFHRAPAGLLFNSGFDANSGFFACVPQPNDIVIYDEYIHASVHDGMRLSRTRQRISFAHNSVADLKSLLEECKRNNGQIEGGQSHVFVAVEAIYSMDGDLAPLKAIVELVETVLPRKNGYVIVDEAHSTGVIGQYGRGLVCDLGLEDKVFARLHTFGKSLACNGAILLCSPLLRQYLINYARPLIYTTFLSYPALAAIRASYTFFQQGGVEPLALHLKMLVRTLFNQLQTLMTKYGSQNVTAALISVPSKCPQSPIFAILTPQPQSLAKHCQDGGFVVRAVVPPTVPVGGSRIRVCLHAGNTTEQIRKLVERIDDWISLQLGQQEAENNSLDIWVEKARL